MKLTMKDVMTANCQIPHAEMLTSNHCAALARELNAMFEAPVPPAGDVEVLGYQTTRVEPTGVARLDRPLRTKTTEWGPAFAIVELVDRAHVTRLTAEVDRWHDLCVERTTERDALQAELIKARELNAEVVESVTGRHGTFARIPADWFDRRDAIAHNDDESCVKDAEAAKCARCEASTVEHCDEKGCGYLGAGNGEPAAKGGD